MKNRKINPLVTLLMIAVVLDLWGAWSKREKLCAILIIVGIFLFLMLMKKTRKEWGPMVWKVGKTKISLISAYIEHRKSLRKMASKPPTEDPQEKLDREKLIQEWLEEKSLSKGWYTWRWIDYEKETILLISPEGEKTSGKIYFKFDHGQPRVSRYIGYTEKGNKKRVVNGRRLAHVSDEVILRYLKTAFEKKEILAVCNKHMINTMNEGKAFIDPTEFAAILDPVDGTKNKKLKLLSKALVDYGGFGTATVEKDNGRELILVTMQGEPV